MTRAECVVTAEEAGSAKKRVCSKTGCADAAHAETILEVCELMDDAKQKKAKTKQNKTKQKATNKQKQQTNKTKPKTKQNKNKTKQNI